ncbi:CAunnamed protein product, partial [Biomphalaria glabrata]
MASSLSSKAKVRDRQGSWLGLRFCAFLIVLLWACESTSLAQRLVYCLEEAEEALAHQFKFRPTCHASMQVTSFEYQKKFNKQLDLGECPMREVSFNLSGTMMYHLKRCPVTQPGTIVHMQTAINDSRNIQIENPSQIVSFIPLCGGEAASFLGILHHGDCVAVDIASKLIFSEKTLVRAYVGYYQESIDVLEPTPMDPRILMDSRMSIFEDNFYVKERSYGTIELVIVHFRFASVNEKLRAAAVKLDTTRMSEYLKRFSLMNVIPTKTTVITLSTTDLNSYNIHHYPGIDYERAIRTVQVAEIKIWTRYEEIKARKLVPHLSYGFYPFLEEDKATLRSVNPLIWEETSMLEIQIRQAINKAKKNVNFCGNNEIKLCVRIRELLATLREFHKDFRLRRANWVALSIEEKNAFTSHYSTRVKPFLSLTESLTRDVKKMKKNERLALKNLTRHTSNEISKTSKKNKKKHPVRHGRKRAEALRRMPRYFVKCSNDTYNLRVVRSTRINIRNSMI